jgi:hypothetical protein
VRVGDLSLGWRSHLLACRFDAQIESHWCLQCRPRRDR